MHRTFAILIGLTLSGDTALARLPKHPPAPDALARYQAAATYSEARAGVAMLVVEGDGIAFARARAGRSIAAAHPIYSGAKGLLCPLVMSAIEDGRLALEDPVGPRFMAGEASIPVRVRDLLGMTSGLDDARWWLEVDGATRRSRVPADRYAFALTLTVAQPPGMVFQYSGVHAAALGGFLVAHDIDPRRVLLDRVFAPLGIKPRAWSTDAAGQPVLAHGLSLSAEQWARIGMLMRDDGRFQGRRLFDAGRLASCLAGSAPMPAYGMGWWLNAPLTREASAQIPPQIREHLAASGRPFAPAPPDLFAAIGSHDQRLYVIPSRGLVIVRLAQENPGDSFIDADFLSLLEP